MTSPSIPLRRQLQSTAQVLLDVRNGRSLTQVLDDVDRTLRPGVQALAFHVMRVQGRAQALRRELARRAPPPAVDALLCTALALAADKQIKIAVCQPKPEYVLAVLAGKTENGSIVS